MNPFVERHQQEISGVLSCFDRVVITGTLPDIGHARAMAQWLGSQGIRLFDYPQWAAPLREELRQNAERLAAEAGWRSSLSAATATFARRRGSRKSSLSAGAPWLGPCVLRHGAVSVLPPLVRTSPATPLASNLPPQVPSLLLLLHRPGVRPGLRAGAHLGAVSPAGLLQRSRLADPSVDCGQHRLRAG